MNTIARRLSGALLTLVLLVLPAAAAHGEPLSGSLDRWTTTISDLLGGLLDRLAWTGAASETVAPSDSDTVALDPTADTTLTSTDEPTATNEAKPSWDPFGAA